MEEQTPIPDPEPAPLDNNSWKPLLLEWAKTIAIVAFLVLSIRAFVVEAYVIKGRSMQNTLEDGERLLISKFSPTFFDLVRGDIVIFHHPDPTERKRLIKRVIGLPGEVVEIRSGIVFINGTALDEPYILDEYRDGSDYSPITVEEGHYYVLGDHRNLSNDSRNRKIGTIAKKFLVGKAKLRFSISPSKWTLY